MADKSQKILIVENEQNIRESLKLILSDQFNLILTDNTEQALDCLKNDKSIGLVLVNGHKILDEIKQKFSDKKVILLTGHKSGETKGEASSIGADGWIVKPFKSKDILETVSKFIK